jgi:endoglucanase
MYRLNTAIATLVLFPFLSLSSIAADAQAVFTKPADGSCRSVTLATCAVASAMGRGVNLGEMLDAPNEGDWGHRVEQEYIEKTTAVFKTIRLPVRFSNHAALTEDATLDEFFAGRVDNIIDALLAKGVFVILDLHGYAQLVGQALPGESILESEIIDRRFLNIWAQLALRYKDKSPKLIFELLNEPVGRLENGKWAVLGAQALAVVRKSNTDRVVLLGGTRWSSAKMLSTLVMGNDPNIIVPVHSYDPFDFTHQGVGYIPWLANTSKTCCDEKQRKTLTDNLDVAKQWSIKNGYPIALGEFGSYHRADMNSRVTWTRFMRDELEKRNFSWTYWTFVGGFGIYDKKTHAWIEPLRAALLD